jgi:hypothetical protein
MLVSLNALNQVDASNLVWLLEGVLIPQPTRSKNGLDGSKCLNISFQPSYRYIKVNSFAPKIYNLQKIFFLPS